MARKTKQSAPVENTALTVVEKKYNSGRKCSVCNHPSITKINFWISTGKSFRHISSHFAVGYRSVGRHTEKCLQLDVHALYEEKKISQAVNHYEELCKQLEFSKELQEACREMLMCEQTGKISFFPRATDIDIVYEDLNDLDIFNRPTRKTKDLQTIINRLQDIPGVINLRPIVKQSDMHDYAITTIIAIDKVLDKFAKVEGKYKKDQEPDEKPKITADDFIYQAKQIAKRNEASLETVLQHGMEKEFIPREFHQEIKLKLAAEVSK